MLSYTKIIRDSYDITMKNKILWLFGLFVVGGVNVNFFQFQNIPFREYHDRFGLWDMSRFFVAHPAWLAATSAFVLIVSLAGLLVTNWSRIMLIRTVNELVEKKYARVDEEMRNSRHFLPSFVRLSLVTTTVVMLSAGVLFFPPWLMDFLPVNRQFLWIAGVVIFIPIVFTISCVNIFAGYFIVLFKKNLPASIQLATDFFAVHWSSVLGLTLVLAAIYAVAFFGGVALIYAVQLLFRVFIETSQTFGNFNFSAMIRLVPIVSNLLLWVVLAGLNVFFNTALLLLFRQLITPVKFEETALSVQQAGAVAK